jgi:hypothetical protein
MSRAEVTKAAPCFSRLLVPAERGSSGLPGTAKSLGKRRRIARDGRRVLLPRQALLPPRPRYRGGCRGRAAAARQHRQGIDGGFRAAKFVDERAEGGGPDVLAADQPEPGEPLATVEPDRRPLCAGPQGLLSPIRASSPLASRPIFAA